MAHLSLPVTPAEKVTLAIEGWNASDLNSRQVFEKCLQSLAGQSYPVHGCQVLVIAEDGIPAGEASWMTTYLPTATFVGVNAPTYYRSKNRAIQEAKGEVLVFADSDVEWRFYCNPRQSETLKSDIQSEI